MQRLLFSVVFLLTCTSYAQEYSARIDIRSERDVIALHRRGLTIDDARIRERRGHDGALQYQVRYLPENGFVTVIASQEQIERLRLEGFDVSNVSLLDFNSFVSHSTVLDTIPFQFGWPRATFNGMSLYDNSPTVADMNKDGQLNVSVTNAWGSYNPTVPPYLIVWRRNGTYLSGFPAALEPGVLQSSADAGISAMGDIFGDDKLEIVCGDENGYLYAFNHDGTSLAGFPIHYGFSVGVFTPALADIDGDGKRDIAVISHNWNSPYSNAQLHLLKVSSSGATEFPGFPINLGLGARNSPAIGDIDGDGQLDIVVGTGGSTDTTNLAKVIAFDRTGQVKPGFPWIVGRNSVGCNPTLYDINNNGKLEILVRVKPDTDINGIYALTDRGGLLSGFPFPITYGHVDACVAVGDMTGDGIPELAYGGVEAVDSGKVWAYTLQGALLPGYPARVFRTWVDGSVAIADVDGDGLGDVVCGTNGVTNKPGLIRAFNHLGQEVAGFPLSPGNPILNSFETHPTLVDIDGDGDTEIFAGRLDKNVYGWDTPGIYDSTKVWTTFKGNPARTGGQLRSPISVDVQAHQDIPSQFSLSQNYPNPFNPKTRIKFRVAGLEFVELSIYDVLGRRVTKLVSEEMQPGSYEVTWDAAGFASGVYFYRLQSDTFADTKKLLLLR